jgi:enamine deaminase RidA (YjgF/YER057c/UK114 family)
MTENTTNTVLKPWTWGDAWGFVPAVVSTGTRRTVHVAGQCDQSREDGSPYHPGDMAAQVAGAIDNVEAVLAAAELTLADVVRLNYYVTDIEAFNAVPHDMHVGRLQAARCFPASTLLGVSALAMPGMLVELEATAVA